MGIIFWITIVGDSLKKLILDPCVKLWRDLPGPSLRGNKARNFVFSHVEVDVQLTVCYLFFIWQYVNTI